MPPEFAVYAEYSDSDKQMVQGWNVRVFNRTEVQHAAGISLEAETGIVQLAPGAYHVTASSIVAYISGEGANPATVPMSLTPFGGYCRLRNADDDAESPNDQALAIGTISNADMLPSLIDTYLLVEQEVRVVLEHQVGDDTDGIYLQVNAGGSSWHVFARMSIRRL
jgi:hypothetical protein